MITVEQAFQTCLDQLLPGVYNLLWLDRNLKPLVKFLIMINNAESALTAMK